MLGRGGWELWEVPLGVYGLHGDGVQVILAIGPMSEHVHVHPEYTAELRLEFDF